MRQNFDGRPHFAYAKDQMGFLWDGIDTEIQVCAGGLAGEEIDSIDLEMIMPSLFIDSDQGGQPRDWLNWFQVVCDLYLERRLPT